MCSWGLLWGLTHVYQLNNCAISCLEAPKKDTVVQMCSDEGQVKVSDDILRFALTPAMTPVSPALFGERLVHPISSTL